MLFCLQVIFHRPEPGLLLQRWRDGLRQPLQHKGRIAIIPLRLQVEGPGEERVVAQGVRNFRLLPLYGGGGYATAKECRKEHEQEGKGTILLHGGFEAGRIVSVLLCLRDPGLWCYGVW